MAHLPLLRDWSPWARIHEAAGDSSGRPESMRQALFTHGSASHASPGCVTNTATSRHAGEFSYDTPALPGSASASCGQLVEAPQRFR
jgi:hypothetical protein